MTKLLEIRKNSFEKFVSFICPKPIEDPIILAYDQIMVKVKIKINEIMLRILQHLNLFPSNLIFKNPKILKKFIIAL